MATSVGERAKQDADAHASRFMARDLKILAMGMGDLKSVHTGKPIVMASHHRRRRVDRHENKVERMTHFEEKDIFGNAWRSVDRISFVGLLHSQEYYDHIMEWLDALDMSIPVLQDFHDTNLFDRLNVASIPVSSLGRMGSPLKDFADPEYKHLGTA